MACSPKIKEATKSAQISVAAWSLGHLGQWFDGLNQEVPFCDVHTSIFVLQTARLISWIKFSTWALELATEMRKKKINLLGLVFPETSNIQLILQNNCGKCGELKTTTQKKNNVIFCSIFTVGKLALCSLK